MLQAIHKRKWISREYIPPVNKRNMSYKYFVRPYKIRYDVQYGRFYLVAFDRRNRCSVSRLDRTESVKVSKDSYEIDNLDELYEMNMKYSWSSVHLGKGNEPQEIKLEIIIYLKKKMNYIIQPLK